MSKERSEKDLAKRKASSREKVICVKETMRKKNGILRRKSKKRFSKEKDVLKRKIKQREESNKRERRKGREQERRLGLVRDTSIQLEAKEVGYEVSRQFILITNKAYLYYGVHKWWK